VLREVDRKSHTGLNFFTVAYPGTGVQVAIVATAESTGARIGSVHDFWTGRVNRNCSDMSELL